MRSKVIACVALLPLMAGCNTEDYATAEEMQMIEDLEVQKQALEKQLTQKEKEGRQLLDDLQAAVASGNRARQNELMAQLDSTKTEWEAILGAWKGRAEAQTNIEQAARARATDGAIATIAPFVPAPFQPFLPLAAYGIGLLAFPRSRENLGKAVGSAAKGQLWDVVTHIGRSIGYAHTNPEPEKVMKGAANVFKTQGDLDSALAVKELAAELTQKRRKNEIDMEAKIAKL